MRRKFTVYGLRFSKTSVWNHINTGFPDPAVATVLTACGIETIKLSVAFTQAMRLQQYLPLAVLKPSVVLRHGLSLRSEVATVLTACGIETIINSKDVICIFPLQQYLPLAVLKQNGHFKHMFCGVFVVATVLTACGIETEDFFFCDNKF